MEQHSIGPLGIFNNLIPDDTNGFIGREWVFKAINDWLADSGGSRFFLLTGEPGCGKTAIAHRLYQFARSQVLSQPGLTCLSDNFISAIHFCSVRDRRWINPYVFSESLALQLSTRHPPFAKALLEKSGNRQIRIDVEQNIQHMSGGQVTGVVIKTLDVGGISPEDAFMQAVREPLEALLSEDSNVQVVILVDALDEALLYSGEVGIVSLLAQSAALPRGIRFILTSRKDEQIENAFRKAETLFLSARNFDEQNQEDIGRYIEARLNHSKELAVKVAEWTNEQRQQLVAEIAEKAAGNFLYVHFLLGAIARGLRSFTELEGLPEGLDELYFDSLERVVKAKKRDWLNEYAPLMGTLSVAQESLTAAQLQAFTGQTESAIWRHLGDLQQFIEEIEQKGRDGEKAYYLYHHSVTDFLHNQWLVVEEKQFRNSFYLPAREWHKTLADRCEGGNLASIWEDVEHNPHEKGRRRYARLHYLVHLYRAHEWQRLFDVLDAGQYGQAKIRYDLSARSYTQDLDIGRQAATWKGWALEEGIALLPQLWRYTLLRCSLNSRADLYTPEAFEALLFLNRESEALGLAELLTSPAKKARALLQIAIYMGRLSGREQEGQQLLLKAERIVKSLLDMRDRVETQIELGVALAMTQQWERATATWDEVETLIPRIDGFDARDQSLDAFVSALIQAEQWDRAEALIHRNKSFPGRYKSLCELVLVFAQKQQWKRAVALIDSANYAELKGGARSKLITVLIEAQQWERAKAQISQWNPSLTKAEALCELAAGLAEAQQWEYVETVLIEAETLTRELKNPQLEAKALCEIGVVLAKMNRWEQSEAIWNEVEALIPLIEELEHETEKLKELYDVDGDDRYNMRFKLGYYNKAEVLQALALALAKTEQWERVTALIQQIEKIDVRAKALQALGVVLTQAHQDKRADTIWNEIETLVPKIKNVNVSDQTWSAFVKTLIEVQQWERAETFIRKIEWEFKEDAWKERESDLDEAQQQRGRAKMLRVLGEALAKAYQWEHARALLIESEVLMRTIEERVPRDEALSALVMALIQLQEWERAEALIRTIEDFSTKVLALNSLAAALAQIQKWEFARAILMEADALIQARRPTRGDDSSNVLPTFVVTLVQAQCWERAKTVIKALPSFSSGNIKSKILQALADMLTKMQQWEQVRPIWDDIRALINSEDINSYVRKKVSLIFLKILAKEEQWKETEALIQKIPKYDDDWRAQALAILGLAFSQAQQQEHAESMWDEAKVIVSKIKSEHIGDEGTRMLIEALVQAQQWKRLKALILAIEDLGSRETARRIIFNALVQTQQWERAKAMINTNEFLNNPYPYIDSFNWLLTLGVELSAAQQREQAQVIWDEAEALIHKIEDDDRRVDALCKVGIALIEAQQWEHTEVIWDEIEKESRSADKHQGFLYDDRGAIHMGRLEFMRLFVGLLIKTQQWERAKALIDVNKNLIDSFNWLLTLGVELSTAQQWEQAQVIWDEAEALIHKIKNDDTRVDALCEIGIALIKAQQWERAEVIWDEVETLIYKISDRDARAKVIKTLMKVLLHVLVQVQPRKEAVRKIYERWLHLVQGAWLRADTRTYAIKLLPLACQFVIPTPEIVTTFGEALAWTDKFLIE